MSIFPVPGSEDELKKFIENLMSGKATPFAEGMLNENSGFQLFKMQNPFEAKFNPIASFDVLEGSYVLHVLDMSETTDIGPTMYLECLINPNYEGEVIASLFDVQELLTNTYFLDFVYALVSQHNAKYPENINIVTSISEARHHSAIAITIKPDTESAPFEMDTSQYHVSHINQIHALPKSSFNIHEVVTTYKHIILPEVVFEISLGGGTLLDIDFKMINMNNIYFEFIEPRLVDAIKILYSQNISLNTNRPLLVDFQVQVKNNLIIINMRVKKALVLDTTTKTACRAESIRDEVLAATGSMNKGNFVFENSLIDIAYGMSSVYTQAVVFTYEPLYESVYNGGLHTMIKINNIILAVDLIRIMNKQPKEVHPCRALPSNNPKISSYWIICDWKTYHESPHSAVLTIRDTFKLYGCVNIKGEIDESVHADIYKLMSEVFDTCPKREDINLEFVYDYNLNGVYMKRYLITSKENTKSSKEVPGMQDLSVTEDAKGAAPKSILGRFFGRRS